MDEDGLPIKYQWRANRFARYLVKTDLQKTRRYGHTVASVTFPLVEQNAHLRKQKYSEYVLAAAKNTKYLHSLIYSIIEN